LLEGVYALEYWICNAAAVSHGMKPASPVFLMSKPGVKGLLPPPSYLIAALCSCVVGSLPERNEQPVEDCGNKNAMV